MPHSLAESLKSKHSKHNISDVFYDIINIRNDFTLKRNISAISLLAGIALSAFLTDKHTALELPNLIQRYDKMGLILALFPILTFFYFLERTAVRHIASRKRLSHINATIMFAPILLLIALDLGLINSSYNIISCALLLTATFLLWPQKRKKSYYTKKHIDKRT